MQNALASLMQGPPPGGGAPPMGPPPNSLGIGPPPNMPGLPPSPEMVGQMPTGSTATNAKQAADVAVASLRDAKGYFPSMNDAIDGLIAQLQSAAQTPTPPISVGAPGGPGAALPIVPPTGDSGTKGPI
ncbi:MAG: hypothetical protein WCB99_08885 [Candidatus Cybelea sp.]